MAHAERFSPSEIVRAERLGKLYPDGNVVALADVNLTIGRGQYLAIVGPSGSGKSTLLHLLGLLDEPTTGQVYFEGQAITALGGTEDWLRLSIVSFAAHVDGPGKRAGADV
jgi:ABC-type lipoprotein export system ATPase subunit